MSNARAAIDNTKSIENNLKDLKKRKAEDNGIEVQEYLKWGCIAIGIETFATPAPAPIADPAAAVTIDSSVPPLLPCTDESPTSTNESSDEIDTTVKGGFEMVQLCMYSLWMCILCIHFLVIGIGL